MKKIAIGKNVHFVKFDVILSFEYYITFNKWKYNEVPVEIVCIFPSFCAIANSSIVLIVFIFEGNAINEWRHPL